MEDQIKEGRTVGTWEHIPQSQSVQVKAWDPRNTRTGQNAKGSKARVTVVSTKPASGAIHE